MYSGDRDINKKEKLAEVILEKKDNVIYVDFVLFSLVEAVKDWYKKYYQGRL
jgi:hypothetical protein